MQLIRNSILTFTVLLIAGSTFSQNIERLARKFEEGVSNQPAEKIFIHNDKPYYFTGETIWFKLYSVDASFHTLSSFSKIAYVELLSDDNQPLFQEKIRLENGNGKRTDIHKCEDWFRYLHPTSLYHINEESRPGNIFFKKTLPLSVLLRPILKW